MPKNTTKCYKQEIQLQSLSLLSIGTKTPKFIVTIRFWLLFVNFSPSSSVTALCDSCALSPSSSVTALCDSCALSPSSSVTALCDSCALFPIKFCDCSLWQLCPFPQYYNKWVSLVGALLCLVVMFLIDYITALVTFVVTIFLYLFVAYRKPGETTPTSQSFQWMVGQKMYYYRLTSEIVCNKLIKSNSIWSRKIKFVLISSSCWL